MVEECEDESSGLDQTISSLCEENDWIKAELSQINEFWRNKAFSNFGNDQDGNSFILSETTNILPTDRLISP